MENNQEWISVNDLAKKVDVSENTLKRYIRRHEQFLTVKQGNRSKYFIHSDSVKIMKQIKKLYNDNMNEEEVNKKLQASGVPLIITVS
ncbi:helix-turn-helix domain-containing protein, partial [Bacillus clarus]